MHIHELCEKSHEIAKQKGWWESERPLREAILMIIVELAEAVQKDRSNDMDGFIEEVADVFIRLGDLVGYMEVDIESEIKKKMEYNKTREIRHGKKY